MIEYIKGEIAELSPASATIDCNGLGYAVNISLNTYAPHPCSVLFQE